MPRDLWDHLSFEEVLEAHNLVLAHDFPSRSYNDRGYATNYACHFVAGTDDERFADRHGHFEARGRVVVTVYTATADAIEYLSQAADQFAQIAEDASAARSHRDPPGSRYATVGGPWDEGLYLEQFDLMETRAGDVRYGGADVETAVVSLSYLVRHQNLVLEVRVGTTAPSGDIDEVLELSLAVANRGADETVGHLPTRE